MIVSFHPIIAGDKNIICAGRDPGPKEADAIKTADAVILPQGCRWSLYEMAAAGCRHVFPDYRARFRFPGKTGQTKLFSHFDLPHPRTRTFACLSEFHDQTGFSPKNSVFDFPLVFKFDWGGEGDTVARVDSADALENILEKTATWERAGQAGFLIQEFIPTDGRSLRVAVIGTRRFSYWRVPPDSGGFGTALAKGAIIDADSDPHLQAAGIATANRLCEKTGINLAGIDLIFPEPSQTPEPQLLEINYFFGRTGIGGSEQYYQILQSEVEKWLKQINVVPEKPRKNRLHL